MGIVVTRRVQDCAKRAAQAKKEAGRTERAATSHRKPIRIVNVGMAVDAVAMARAAITTARRARRGRSAFRVIVSTAFVVAMFAPARVTRAPPRKRDKARTDRVGRLSAVEIPTMNATRANAMARARAIKHNCSPMVRHVHSARNALPGSAWIVCAATTLAPARVWRARPSKWGKAHPGRVASLPAAWIRTMNAPLECATDPDRACPFAPLLARREAAARPIVHHARLS